MKRTLRADSPGPSPKCANRSNSQPLQLNPGDNTLSELVFLVTNGASPYGYTINVEGPEDFKSTSSGLVDTDRPNIELHLGPEELLVAAKVAVAKDATATDIAAAIDGAERRVRGAVQIARVIYIEPDIFRPAAKTESTSGAIPAHQQA